MSPQPFGQKLVSVAQHFAFSYCNLKNTLLLIILIALGGCFSSTRFQGLAYCPAYLSAGDTAVLSSLPLSNWEPALATINKELKSRNVTVLYAPAEEWKLKVAGIYDVTDSLNNKLLLTNGITHVLQIRDVHVKSGQSYSYENNDPFRTDPYYIRPNDKDDYVVELEVRLQSIKTKQYYSFIVKTTIGGMEVSQDKDGASSVNLGSIERAKNIAIKKAANRLANHCK